MMENEKKNPFSTPLPRGNSTHAVLTAVVGGYLMYLAWQMVQNTLTGNSSMSMTLTVILAGVMALAGLAVICYGIYIWRFSKKKMEDESESSVEET